ncbi:hypothetical protein SKAU_G00370650 [Synaphobranchus kaupii]|uniref:Uncharacterized protein n=1 Tax=Synaphobranchus kaupii TaxID=118154 RepID=A0A9Q1IFV6_SYNKA|nr:hypothetical protein SKAU_G00370650 [Synaphobranchus kaupii]
MPRLVRGLTFPEPVHLRRGRTRPTHPARLLRGWAWPPQVAAASHCDRGERPSVKYHFPTEWRSRGERIRSFTRAHNASLGPGAVNRDSLTGGVCCRSAHLSPVRWEQAPLWGPERAKLFVCEISCPPVHSSPRSQLS